MEYEASGEDYILTTEQNIAEQNGMRSSHVKGRYITFPEAGYAYDFRDATQPVWVCGKPYSTVTNGQSGPVDVQGKQIKISGVNKGDSTEFARIWFRDETTMRTWDEMNPEAPTLGYAQEQAGYVKPPTTSSRKIVVDGEEFELHSFIRGDFSCRR